MGARIADSAAQTWRKDEADGLDGGKGEAGRRGHEPRCLQEAQQHIPHDTVFGSDPRRCGCCDRSAETEGDGGPRRAMVGTDLSNAYGSMSRQCALEAVRIHGPQMLGILCTQWESGSTSAWLQTADAKPSGTWSEAHGKARLLPTPLFASRSKKQETRKKTENGQDDETRGKTGEVKVLAHADDAFLLGAARVVNLFLDFLEGRLEHHGLKLVWVKSHCVDPERGSDGRDSDRTSA